MADEVIVPQDATNPDEELELEDIQDDTDDVEVLKDQLAKKDTFARQALARAKKAEADLKKAKESQPPQKKDEPALSQASPTNVEETVLLANGMDEELLGELKAVATVRKTSLIKAQTDPIFVAVKEKFEKDKKSQQASMSVSRGSATVKPKKDFKTAGLSRDEHRSMVEALN